MIFVVAKRKEYRDKLRIVNRLERWRHFFERKDVNGGFYASRGFFRVVWDVSRTGLEGL